MEKLDSDAKSCQICRFGRFLQRQQDNANTEALLSSLRQKDALLLSSKSIFMCELARMAEGSTAFRRKTFALPITMTCFFAVVYGETD